MTRRTVVDEMRETVYTVEDVGEEWLRTLEGQNYSPNTIKSYASRLRVFLDWFEREFSRPPLMTDLDTTREGKAGGKAVGNRFKTALQRERAAPGTINHSITVLQGLTRYALDNTYLDDDTMPEVTRVRTGKRLPSALTDEQIEAVEARLDETQKLDFRNLVMLRLMLDTGLRCAEVCGMRLDHLEIDTPSGRPLPRGTVTIIGKGNKERRVGFGDWTTKKLRRYVRHVRPRPAGDEHAPFVFLTQLGTRLRGNHLYHIIAELGRRAGVKLHPHLLRHTFATNYVSPRAGVESGNVAELMDLLGHTDPKMSMRYVHLAGSRANIEKQQRLSHTDARLSELSATRLSAAGGLIRRPRLLFRAQKGREQGVG